MKEIRFVVNGEPMAKQRPRVSTFNGYARAYTPKETIMYENKVLSCYKDSIKGTEYENKIVFDNDTCVKLYIDVYFGLTKGDFGKKGLNKSGREKIIKGYCTKHKDLDNCIKIIQDALNGICYKDDKQIVSVIANKMWTKDQPRVEVTLLEPMSDED